jgi:hypothetical protein
MTKEGNGCRVRPFFATVVFWVPHMKQHVKKKFMSKALLHHRCNNHPASEEN